MVHQKIPGLCDSLSLAKRSLRSAKGIFAHSADHNSKDIACLKKAGESEASVRKILSAAGFSQAEADAAVASHYPAQP
jgi:hypothetical protein